MRLKSALLFSTILYCFCWLTADDRPNILFILADDLGYGDLSSYGSTDIPTPHIDKLAAQGVRFTNGYSSHAFCSPMRAGLMAVRYQHRFGYENNVGYDFNNTLMGLPVSEKTVAKRLQEAGYRTGIVGKWHLGAAAPFLPNNRGFDYFYGFPGGGHRYYEIDLNRVLNTGYYGGLRRNEKPTTFEGYLTHALTDEAIAFIERNQERPFFLYLAYNTPHTPLQAPQEYIDKFSHIEDPKRRVYAAMVSTLDDDVGRVVDKVEELGLRENTLIIFLSDNGGALQHGANNGALRGDKGDIWEGGIRVPFMLSWPGVIPQGEVTDEMAISFDLMRTALELGNTEIDNKIEGKNLIPYLTGVKNFPIHEHLFWRFANEGKEFAVRKGPWKLLKSENYEGLKLYNLDSDISETKDVFAQHPEVVAELQTAYDEWDANTLPPFFPSFRIYMQKLREFHETIVNQEWDYNH